MYTIQKYLETNIAAWFFCLLSTYFLAGGAGEVERAEFSVGHCFLRQRSIRAFQPALGATGTMPGKGFRPPGEPALFVNEIGRWGKARHGEQ